jgi:uncharacterized membrane protein
VAIPFAFALHFAASAELPDNPVPLGLLLLLLSAAACWLESKGAQRSAAVTAAGACLAIVGLWLLNHHTTPGQAWTITALCLAMAGLFTAAAERWRDGEQSEGLGLGALVASLGFVVITALAASEPMVVRPWPWVAAWIGLGGLLILHSRWPNRGWLVMAAGASPALGLVIAIDAHARREGAVESWIWIGLAAFFAIVMQFVALAIRDTSRRLWAERAAAVTALAMLPAMSALVAVTRSNVAPALGAALILGVLGALAATRMRSGPWLLAATVATAAFQTIICGDAFTQAPKGPMLALLAVSAVLFTFWPALVPAAFRNHRSAWWGAALAGPLWFLALYFTYVEHFGDATIGLLPVGLAAAALIAALWVAPRLSSDETARRTVMVWYLAVVLSLISVAIPLQLEKEWITIGWALNGIALVALWVRLDHPGLKYLALALLGAATIRLVANPEVLSYHVRAGTPVLNWLTYTYLVPAAALVLSLRLLRPREVERLTELEQRLYPVEKPIFAAACGLSAVVVVFAWINLAIADLFATGRWLELSLERLPARDATTSVAWALYALVLLAIGVRSKSGSLRWLSLGVIVLTLGKVFLHDLGELEDLYRVASLVGLAVSLIVVSLIYQKFVFRSDPEDDA